MAEFRICRICLSTGAKFYRLDRFQLKAYYEEVMAVKVNDNDNLPQYFCVECATMLHKFHKFKEKCYCGQKAFKELLWRGSVTYETVNKLDRKEKNITPILQILNNTNRIKYYHFKGNDPPESFIKAESQNMEKVEIDYIGDNSIGDQMDNLEETDPVAIDTNENADLSESTHQTIFVDIKKETVKEEQVFKRKRDDLWEEQNVMRYRAITNRRTRFLDANKWKKYNLSEQEAVKEFKAKAEDTKYLRASYKCTDCYKGFSKDEMLYRHVQLRHGESLGSFECRFCKMRFKWDSHLRIHMRQHFTKYQCLRCHFVCPLENSAILHEEYHSGITRKCIHCGEEFRHASTYYTHVRTAHRSGYVCTACGVSFVSETGLHQHRRVKHSVERDPDSPDDDEAVDTHCDRCEMRFDTRKAYEEHLFHSVMHSEGVEHEIRDELTIPRKVLGKRLRAKIARESRREGERGEAEPRRRRRAERRRRKPTACHQCGEHFDTQSACMKHHLAAHPRTSFHPPAARHICELCGASLAPGSVAVHRNMHSRERLHACAACGKQFHSTVGLRRHMVTHTGEKRFACSLCEKRFTQSNSMKLHYRTFHLKQPYPKRNRKRKKETSAEEEVEELEQIEEEERSELDSPPGPEPEQLQMPLELDHEETVHYLTLN